MKQRIISAAVAIVIAAVVLYFNKTLLFTLAISLISALIVYELLKSTDCLKNKILSYAEIAFVFLNPFVITLMSEYAGIFWMADVLAVFIIFISDHKNIRYDRFFSSVSFAVLVSLSFSAIIKLNDGFSRMYVIMALCSAWIADTGAYFVGSAIGKHRLSPEISPKKSVEGFIGGIILNAAVLEILYALVLNKDGDIYKNIIFLVTALLCGAIGTLGDLSASVIKRQNNIKDFGNIMPGHGGALDRFDSVLLAAPFFYIMASTFAL